MEVVHQVKLLLRRNVALRLRQPVILALELLWPVAIFLVVMTARNAIPPVAQPTCHYKAWALPSAGVVPFVQSMICNIDECQNETEYEDIPSYKGSSVRQLVANTMPLIMDQDITELVAALPKGMRLMRVAVDALSGPDLSALLDDGFPIRNLLKNINQTRESLRSIDIASEDIELIFDSSIQLPQILEITSQSNLCDIDQHTIHRPSDIFDKLRRHLCSLDETIRKDFFRQLKNQLDVKNIVQTMGLAMSELGRLDVGEILGNIGGLLINLQSSNIFHEDTLKIVSMLLEEVQFDKIDTKVLSLLIEDLEPLYGDSQWAPLIHILKDIKFPSVKENPINSENARRADTIDTRMPEKSEKEVATMPGNVAVDDLFNLTHNVSSILKIFLDIMVPGVNVIKFLPEETAVQVHSAMKFFPVLVDIADELGKSLKKDNSTKFVDTVSDVLGAVFLSIANGAKPTDQKTSETSKFKKFCDDKEFQKIVHSSEWQNNPVIQQYMCRISKLKEKMHDSTNGADLKMWSSSLSKLQKIFNGGEYPKIHHNVLRWENESNSNVSVERKLPFAKPTINEGNIDDFIASIECGIQGLQGLSHKQEPTQINNIQNTSTSFLRPFETEISNQITNNQERLLLLGLTRTKEITNYFRSNPLLIGLSNNTDFGIILAELNKLMNTAGGEHLNQLPAASQEFFHLIPAIMFIATDFSTNATLRDGLPSLISAFVQDLESYTWKSITPKMVEDFSMKNASKHFCVDAEALEATQLHWKWMLCTDSTSSFKIPLPNKKTWKMGNMTSTFDMKVNTGASFSPQDFTRILLHLSTSLGFAFKVMSQFIEPVLGCESTCGGKDVMLKKMCFLGRLQNVKNGIHESMTSKKEEAVTDSNDDVLKQLQQLIPVDKEISQGYDTFMDVVRTSAVNNYTDWKDVVQLVVSGLRFLDTFDSKDQKLRPTLHVTNSLISLLKNRVSDAAQSRTSPMVEIQNVFPDSPLTQEVVKSLLPLLPEVTSTFFWTALAPGKILNLVMESEKNISVIMSVLCNSSLTEYLYNPALTTDEFEILGEALCRHKYYDVFEEIFQDPDIQEIVFEASSTDEVSWDDMHENVLEIVSLLRDLAEVRKADISSFPPLTKWQKMAMDIHAQAMNPSVMLYIFNNKIFYNFCKGNAINMPLSLKRFFTEGKEMVLYRTLCSMSTPAFARRLVVQVTENMQNSVAGPESKEDVFNLATKVWRGISGMSEINNIANVVLGVDLSDDMDTAESSPTGVNVQSGILRKRIMNATERAFDIVDSISDGKLSAAILGTSIPEVLEDISLIFLNSDGVINFDNLFKNGSKSDQVLNAFLQNNPERQRVESYIQTLTEFFSKEDNSRDLRVLCNGPKPNRTSESEIGDFNKMVCSHSPSRWSIDSLSQYQSNMTLLWVQMDQFLTEDIKNATQKMYFNKRKMEFLKSIDKMLVSGIRVADWSSVQMSSFYFNMMRSFVRNLNNINNSSLQGISCLTRSSEMAIRYSTRKLLNSIPAAEFLSCNLLSKNISEFYSWFSKSSHLRTALAKVSNGTKKGETCRHSWKWLLFTIDDIEDLYKKLSENLPEEDVMKIKGCIKNFKKSPLFSSLVMHANVMQQTAKFLSNLNAPAGFWKGINEQIFERISQHLPAFLKISEVIPQQFSALLPEFEASDSDFMKSMRETSINFNWWLRQGFSSVALRKKLCKISDPQKVVTVFSYPPKATRTTSLKLEDFFCRKNGTEYLLQQMNQSAIRIKVKEIQEKDFFSGPWLQELANSSDILIEVGSYLVSSLKEIHIQTPFDVFELFMKPHVIQNIAESFGKLMNVLDPVFPASLLIETLQQVVDGLKAFKSLTQLSNFTFTYKVKDVFGNNVRDVLLNEMLLDSEFVDSFLETEINLKEVITDKETGQVSLCDSVHDSSILCMLSSNPRTAVSAERLQDLVFQRFLLSFGTLGVEGVLREAEVDIKEAGQTLQVLASAPSVVSKLTNYLDTVTNVLHPEVGELFQKLNQDSDWLATPEALSTGGQILCGKPLISLSRKFLLLAPEDTENKIEEKELRRLPTDFCRHGYKEIMKMRGGAILWGFLKPLFRGKILYAPKNYVPAHVVISKVNETFNILEDHVRFIKAAAEGTSGLHYLQRKNETLQSLQKLLSSKAVSKFLGSPSWDSALSWLKAPSSSSRSLLHLVELVGNVTQCISLDRFLGFDTEEELENAAATLHDRREFIAAIVFMEEEKMSEKMGIEKRWIEKHQPSQLPKNIMYKIRMDIDNVPTTEYMKYRWWRPYPYDDFFEDLRYFRGFIQLQDIIDTAITDLQLQSSPQPGDVKKYLQQFPYPCHQRDKFGTLLKGSMPAVMTISWVFIVAFLVRERVLDRELELDETLSVMGLKKSSGWLAWFVTGLSVLLVSVVGIVAVLKWGGITPNSDPVLLFLFVADFAVLLIAYCQLMSTFFDRASTAALLSVLLYVLSFFPFLLFVTWELDFLYWQKLLSCCLVSTSFCFGCLYLNRYEDQGQGVHWSNLWQSPVAEDRMNFGTTLVAMILCSMIYCFISWYVSRILAGYKGRKPLAWYVVFKPPSFGEEQLQNGSNKQNMNSKKNTIEGGFKNREGKDEKKTVGITISNVHALYSKRGSKKWRALSGLNLDLYEDHITALLGHNGAGKTTTIKILTGRIQPTMGSVTLHGFSVPQQLSEARKVIGFCPQNNTLYDKLTVKEHLNLFARLKGFVVDDNSVESDVAEMLDRLNLTEKQNECTETLSGGQRRRLCVGIAFIGGSKVVILDEPTSSVDPVARRSIWDLILSYKKGRTILFTTHHLDEADILSDRVAILHKGRMLCSGSPLELKGRFGSGYRLSLLPGMEKSEGEEQDSGRASSITENEEQVNVDCDGVMEFIQSYVPDATLLENDDSRLVVSLPAEPLTLKPLSEFFAHLEKCLNMWGFHSCSLSSATLEEVFLTLCRLEDAKAAHNSDKFSDMSPFRVKKPNDTAFIQANDDCCKKCDNSLALEIKDQKTSNSDHFCIAHLKYNQLKSLVKKRFWHTKRNWKALTSSIVMPCLFIALAMGLAVGRPQKAPDPSIELTPSLYSTNDHKGVSFFSFEDSGTSLGLTLLKTLEANISQREICHQGYPNCLPSLEVSDSGILMKPGHRCLCDRECPAVTKSPTSSIPTPNQMLYNMSDLNIPRYLLDSYLQFNEKRYGGWTFKREEHTEISTKVWFENSGYHSAPAYLNTLNNAILKTTRPDLGIQTWSHPLRLSVEQLGRETLLHRLGEVGIAFVFLIGLSLVPCTFAVYVVGERESDQKRLQMVTGALGPFLYWSAALLWDMSIVLVTSMISAAIVSSFGLPAFYQRENFRAVYTLIFLYGWATTPLTYLCCRFFHEGSLAFMVIFTSHLFVGLVIMLSLVSLRMISISKDVATTLDLLQKFSLAFPQYSLVGGLTDLNENQIRTEIFAQFGQDVYMSPFGWNSLGPNFVALFVQGIVFFFLTVLLEVLPLRHWCQRLLIGRRKPYVLEEINEDEQKPLLQIQNISQVYHTKAGNRYAVDNFTLTVPQGDCFGLVGANGAGKTTLFRLLIGEIQPTSGKIISVGVQSKASPKHQFLGYCPQKDALDGLLTPRQHLEVYAGLRGIRSSEVHKIVECSLQSLELEVHADRPVHTLSGGTKRKLCTAIATLGDPELSLLDEPTSGMDPATRRLVWKCISRATEAGRSVILTSHSIEDCDVLCSRLGIMVNGRLACLDSPAKLKTRLGTGYTLSFRIPEGKNWTALSNFIHKEIPSAHLQVHSGRRIEINLPDENVTLSSLFCQLEECAKQFGIEDLAIDPTTLDQVFVNFVRQQSDAVQNKNKQPECKVNVPTSDMYFEMCSTKL